MSTFTPGPWKATTVHGEGASLLLVMADGPTQLAKMVAGNHHDARMMAAAPDLLEACFLAWVEIDQFHSTAYPKCDGGCPAHEALDRIKAAVSKALERPATVEEAESFMWDYRPPEVKR
jgi:hypothetical protein